MAKTIEQAIRIGCADAKRGKNTPANAEGTTAAYREGHRICRRLILGKRLSKPGTSPRVLTKEEERVAKKYDLHSEVHHEAAMAAMKRAGLGRARGGGLRGAKRPSGERDYMVTTRQGEGRRNLTKAEAIALARVRTVEWAEVGQDAGAKVIYQVTGGLIPWEKGQLKGLGRARRTVKKRSR